jgi:hypothetical protein
MTALRLVKAPTDPRAEARNARRRQKRAHPKPSKALVEKASVEREILTVLKGLMDDLAEADQALQAAKRRLAVVVAAGNGNVHLASDWLAALVNQVFKERHPLARKPLTSRLITNAAGWEFEGAVRVRARYAESIKALQALLLRPQ